MSIVVPVLKKHGLSHKDTVQLRVDSCKALSELGSWGVGGQDRGWRGQEMGRRVPERDGRGQEELLNQGLLGQSLSRNHPDTSRQGHEVFQAGIRPCEELKA